MIQPVIILSLSLMLMLLPAAAAPGDDMVAIRIYNDGTDVMDVTVYDMNTQPPGAVLANQRINGFAWIPVSVTAGASGNGHVMWIARTTDARFHRCGNEERRGLANDDSVEVFAGSRCIKITP